MSRDARDCMRKTPKNIDSCLFTKRIETDSEGDGKKTSKIYSRVLNQMLSVINYVNKWQEFEYEPDSSRSLFHAGRYDID